MNRIYQIYYDDETRSQCDPGFLPLDNTSNARPDWREYWPIRNFFQSEACHEDGLYGFFSSRFKSKTGLGSQQVHAFLEQNPGHDIYLFSPFFDQSAFFLNVFHQGESVHPGLMALANAFVQRSDHQPLNLEALVMSSHNTVFCNYFVAKLPFWRQWLQLTEALYRMAEEGHGDLALALNGDTTYMRGHAPAKVFLLERVASLLMAVQSWKVLAYNPQKLSYSRHPIATYKHELAAMDALKAKYTSTPWVQYLHAFANLRSGVLQKVAH